MSSTFLERFRNRIQKISKDGKLFINGNFKIISDQKSSQKHKNYEISPKLISTPTSYSSISPARLYRNHSNIPKFCTPTRGQNFLDTYKRPQRSRAYSQMRESIKKELKELKALPSKSNYQIIHKVRFASPDVNRRE